MNKCSGSAAALYSVVKHYGSTVALDRVELAIERGKMTALLGPNGAGKTTAISLLLGLTAPTRGRVEVLGGSPLQLATKRRVGVMLQNPGLPDTLRVHELLKLVATYYPRPRPAARTGEVAGIKSLFGRRYGELSKGEQRRVQFALALCGDAELLFLDEPTTGLDIEARKAVWSAIREQIGEGRTVVLTTHYIEEAEALADHAIVLVRGRVVATGTVEQIRSQVTRQYIRCKSRIAPREVRRWPGVIEVEQRDEWLSAEVASAEPVVRRLLDGDPDLSGLEVSRAGLAEALTQITREAAA